MKTFSIYGSDALRASEDKIEFCFVCVCSCSTCRCRQLNHLEVLGSASAVALTEWERQETVCKRLHESMTCLGLFCGRRVFLLLYVEGSFTLLPADDMTTAVIADAWVTRQWNGNLFCNAQAIALENVTLSQQLELFYLLFPAIIAYCWCSRGTSTWSLLPYTYLKNNDVCWLTWDQVSVEKSD